MVCDRSMNLDWRVWTGLSMGGLSAVLGGSLIPSAAVAQVIPDNTLGPETSVVVDIDPSTQIIEGGATRGSNLFHSFLEFNIAPGSALYFNPDSGISDILTRITGPNPSAIEGLLGVNGSANLYLLNPNGILFGPNASLDITGSFHAIAAPYLPLGNSIFSATAPQSSNLLSISPDVSLFNYLTSGDITSSAALSTGQALTLAGNNLQLSNQLQAGSDLTLLASDTVTIRDSADTAFLARSGDDLTVQGTNSIDILALQHLDLTPFVSGQDLTFISDGFISTDAHFESGGNLQFLTLSGAPGNLLSLYDPIISANGDIVFGNYTGVALKVEATGSIQGGNIRITGPDTTFTPDGSGSDQDLLASSRAAILRAGVASVGTPNTPLTAGDPNGFPPGQTTFDTGVVAGQPSGSITVNNIFTPGIPGGPIILQATENITITGDLGSTSNGGDGGMISLSTEGGDINIAGSLNSSAFSSSGDSGNGGEITLSTEGGDINIAGSLNSSAFSSSGDSGNGGEITLSTEGGDINIAGSLRSSTFSSSGNSGNGGEVALSTEDGNINIENVFSTSTSSGDSGFGGGILFYSRNGNINTRSLIATTNSFSNRARNGGRISLLAENGSIDIRGANSLSSSSSGNGGRGGDITLTSGEGIRVEFLQSNSLSDSGSAGNGGGISLAAKNGDISVGSSIFQAGSSSNSGNAGNGGDISLIAENGGIVVESAASSSSSSSGNAGNGGDISLIAESGSINVSSGLTSGSSSDSGNAGVGGNIAISAVGNIMVPLLSSGSLSNQGNAGPGGNISLTATEDIHLDPSSSFTGSGIYTSSFSSLGSAYDGGDIFISSGGSISGINSELISFSITQGNTLQTSGRGGSIVLISQGGISSFRVVTIASDGVSGDVDFQSLGNLLIDDVALIVSAQVVIPNLTGGPIFIVDTTGFGQSGDTTIDASGDLTLNNVEILSDANGSVSGGQILIENANNVILNNSQLLSDTNANGVGGDIILRNLGSLTLNNSTFTTDTAGATPTSDAGNIVIDDVGVFLMRNNSLVRVNAENGANAGDINIATDFIVGVPGENNDIIANAVGGNGGRIFATATGIYGFTERNGFTFSELRNLSTNDISASSLFARDGEVSLTFEETPSAEDLPSDFLDSDSLISNSCITPDNQVAGSFTIPGAGGLPATPADVTTSNYSTGDVQTLPGSSPSSNVEGWQLGDPIVEPDSVAQLTDGRVVLGRRCN
jgi:filamentous hemagglutinin family protein